MIILLLEVLVTHHSDSLQVVEESFVAVFLDDIELMRVPELRENLLDVVLVHAELHQMDLGTLLTDKCAVGDIGVGRLALLTVDTVRVELVICD